MGAQRLLYHNLFCNADALSNISVVPWPWRGRRGTDARDVLFCHTTAPSTVLVPHPGPVVAAVVSESLGTGGQVTSVLTREQKKGSCQCLIN